MPKTRIKGVMGHNADVGVSGMDDEMKKTLGFKVPKPKKLPEKPGRRLVTNGPMGKFAEKINKRKKKP